MDRLEKRIGEHRLLARRYFLQLGGAATAAWSASPLAAQTTPPDPALRDAIARLEYLTPLERARTLDRGNPPPSKLAPEKQREVGLVPETWFLELGADPAGNSAVERSFSREQDNAFDWKALMELAARHAVRYMHVCACTNVADPFHMCVWEGVPLRELVWLTRPAANVRRVYYYGYHTENSPRFQSSLPLGQVLETPPGEMPVMLAYKMNGQLIPATLGGPVRMIVPGSYANRSVKWLQHIVLTNDFKANDTYAEMNNDVESPIKTTARFIAPPRDAAAETPVAVTGLALVGISGIRKVQVSVHSQQNPWPADDPYRTKAEWKDAAILPPPANWGGGLPGNKLPPLPGQIDPANGAPVRWPIPYTIVHWAALLPGLPPGSYDLCCRTIDGNGIAQPMPRPLPRTGSNGIQRVTLAVRQRA
jgi:hypothetical protein